MGKERPTRDQELSDRIKWLAQQARLNSWTEFVRSLPVPTELLPAVMSGRAALVNLVQPRDLKANEVKALYDLIGGLLETNAALRTHAVETAQLVDNLVGTIKSLPALAERVKHFAYFRHAEAAAPGESQT